MGISIPVAAQSGKSATQVSAAQAVLSAVVDPAAAPAQLFPSIAADPKLSGSFAITSRSTVTSKVETVTMLVFAPSPLPPSPPPNPPPMCQCDELRDGANVFNTCVKYAKKKAGKIAICKGSNRFACPSDYSPCPGFFGATSSGKNCPPDKKGKWRKKKCQKKAAK